MVATASRRAIGALVAFALVDGAASCATSAPHAHRAEARVPVARFARVAVSYESARFDPRREARRLDLWIAQGLGRRYVRTMRTTRSSAQALLYKEAIYADMSNPNSAAAIDNPGGVSAREVRAHPSWLLRDPSGRPVHSASYAPYELLDVGDPDYQRAWAANVIRQTKRDRWSGVFADDLSLALSGTSSPPARYPTPEAWQDAVRRFVMAVRPRLRRAGIRLVTNTSSGVTFPAARRALVRLTDGTMEEGWMRPDGDANAPLVTSPGTWDRQLEELADSERAGRTFVAELPAADSDRRAVRYALASFLLRAGGHGVFAVSGDPPHRRALWYGDYDRARRLGRPSGAASELAGGVWVRPFERGLVLVNPTDGRLSAQPGELPRSARPRARRTIELPPTSGLVLVAR